MNLSDRIAIPRPRSQVDPRAPRFGQAITASLLLAGVGLQRPVLVYVVAGILATAVLSRWRVDLYGILWRRVVLSVVAPPVEREPAIPHRFAKLLGAAGTAIASVCLLFGLPTIGLGIAALVGLFAALGALTGFCLGCRMYEQVSFFRRHDVI